MRSWKACSPISRSSGQGVSPTMSRSSCSVARTPAPADAGAGAVVAERGSGEDADATGADGEPDDHEDETPEEVPLDQPDDAGHHEDHRDDPQDECHVTSPPLWLVVSGRSCSRARARPDAGELVEARGGVLPVGDGEERLRPLGLLVPVVEVVRVLPRVGDEECRRVGEMAVL